MAEYADYYQRTIARAKYGLKLALGGTGIGKTRGIREVVKASRYGDKQQKYIYCANRVQLLDEMYDDLIQKGGFSDEEVIHLERNRDTVVNAITEYPESFYQLLNHPQIKDYAQALRLDRPAVERACKQIEQIAVLLEEHHPESNINQLMSTSLETLSRDVLNFFRNVLRNASDSDRAVLLYDPVIQTLFPYIAFKLNANARILLLTIHKAFLGFFDGHANTNMNEFKDCIIFLDEFDFLEPDLTKLICESPQIEDPFVFVEMFYRAMTRHKLPLDNYPIEEPQEERLAGIRDRLIEIVNHIDTLKADEGIPFPEINQFTTSIKRRQAAIFQTNRTIIREPLYLHKTPRSFEIVFDSYPENILAVRLFNEVSQATAKILYLFKEIETIDQTIYDEMLTHCFPQSHLADQVSRISQLPGIYRDQSTRFDNLLESGFGLYEIEDLQQVTDREEVKFRHYAIHITPEKILLALAQKNLVFGLSATADLPRFVKHFNEHWLRKQLNATNDATYFEVDKEDEQIIQELNIRKLERRQNNVEVLLAKDLEEYPEGKKFVTYISHIAKHFSDGFGVDDPNGHRRKRAEHFFGAVLNILQQRNLAETTTNTHILFYTTFAQIRFIFKTPACHNHDLFQIESVSDNRHFLAYRLKIAGQLLNIIFYDAAQAKFIHQAEHVKKQYHQLFWEGIPVLLVTQYASAGNGVNLQYRPSSDASSDDEVDFQYIHLMEAPFFFFDEIDPHEQTLLEVSAAIKKNIWYQAKLFEAKVINAERFFGVLENLRHDPSNSYYRSGNNPELLADSLKNRLATYIQALGRVERVWDRTPDQTIFLSEDVYDDFARFVQDEPYAHLREQRLPRLSKNLVRMMEQIDIMASDRKKIARRHADERLATQDKRCEEYIRELLQRLHAFRQGNTDEGVKHEWINLRHAALEHSFASDLLAKYKAVFKTNYLDHGVLYIDKDNNLYPHDKRPYDSYPWRLNAIYDLIKANPQIAHYFRANGYELAFDGINGQFFVPTFYQAILVGAIGEAAVKVILEENLVNATEDLPTQLFELADLKIDNTPWYIDCKNYSERTLAQFHYAPDDPAYRNKLTDSDFMRAAKSKLQQIRNYHTDYLVEQPKLIYLNLLSNQDRVKRYFDANFEEVMNFEQAQIIVIQGVLQSDSPAQYTSPFKQFITDLGQYKA